MSIRTRSHVGLSLAMTALALLVSACGATTPAAPSSASGASINGAIVSSTSGTASGQSVANLVVTVPGTTLSAPVSSGRFALTGVPAGDVTLKFSGSGVDGTVTLPAVQTSEAISVDVSVDSGAVVLESQRRQMGGDEQLEGRVESLPPVTPAGTLVVAGITVTTSAGTQYFLNGSPGSFADLAIGLRVHVSGTATGGVVAAATIQIQNTNPDIPVEINGTVTAFSGDQTAFQFMVDGRSIHGDLNTEFFGGSQFTDLANDARVEVKGAERNGFVYATRIHVNTDGSGDPGQDTSASIEGALTAKSGTIPVLTLTVDGTTVRTSAATQVQRRGDVQDLSVLALGMTLHVVGDRQTDGSLDARLIQIKDDAAGSPFEIQGSMGGVHGTCPSLTFVVNGYSVFTDATTAFTPACSEFRSGTKATVKGIVQADGTVKATSVEK